MNAKMDVTDKDEYAAEKAKQTYYAGDVQGAGGRDSADNSSLV
jgi:hypothetical protein